MVIFTGFFAKNRKSREFFNFWLEKGQKRVVFWKSRISEKKRDFLGEKISHIMTEGKKTKTENTPLKPWGGTGGAKICPKRIRKICIGHYMWKNGIFINFPFFCIGHYMWDFLKIWKMSRKILGFLPKIPLF